MVHETLLSKGTEVVGSWTSANIGAVAVGGAVETVADMKRGTTELGYGREIRRRRKQYSECIKYNKKYQL